ncbi:dihydrofolate reductase [Treponema phagedenis]|uniref:dihydrofolate reductase n=1 Tax=Treponema phagedenis TaxID=162 RepID=UPI0001F63CC1|nr:dihydrofolate reductase [Treponema phagedenis]EFW37647.1 dihydrofolate reductase [Treponema phagedenis F0421]TYT79576.1 dihydrofolate reductase [Treponema phagedenis]
MTVSFILARSENKAIGCANGLPWLCPEDMAYFKKRTMGSLCLVGRKTFQTLPQGGLPGRRLIVITSRPFVQSDTVQSVAGIEEALQLCQGRQNVFCIGGLSLYKQLLPFAEVIYLTEVHGTYDGDVFFGDDLLSGFERVSLQQGETCDFIEYRRKLH